MPERPRLAGEPSRVALPADGGNIVGAAAFDCERAGANLVPDAADNGRRLAGEDRFVECEPVAPAQDSVGHDLVTRLEQHDVVLDHLIDTDPARLAVAHDGRG